MAKIYPVRPDPLTGSSPSKLRPADLQWAGSGRIPLLAALAFVLAGIMIFGRLGGLPLIQPDEGRNAEVAREMKDSGSWLVPTYNGLPYLDKPAFYFKTVALSFALLGQTEAAARLSSALSGLLLLVLMFVFVRRSTQPRS